jgi:UDP-glucose-4-epimerase GalE
LNLLEAMRRHGVRFIVFSSTCAIYGIPPRVPMSESTPKAPVNPYGYTKMVIERILEDYERAHDIRFVALRYFNAAGACPDATIGEWHNPETHLIPRLFEAALGRAEGAQIYGDDYPTKDGTCVRDYIHVTDLATAHVAAIEGLIAGKPSDYFNLGTGQGLSVLEVVEQVMRTSGSRFPVKRMPRRAGDPPALVADPSKANSVLGWVPTHSSIQEIVETAWNWHTRQSPAGVSRRQFV